MGAEESDNCARMMSTFKEVCLDIGVSIAGGTNKEKHGSMYYVQMLVQCLCMICVTLWHIYFKII